MHAIGQGVARAMGKHGVKHVDRLPSNESIDVEARISYGVPAGEGVTGPPEHSGFPRSGRYLHPGREDGGIRFRKAAPGGEHHG